MEMGEQVERGGREGKALNNDDERASASRSIGVGCENRRPRFHKRAAARRQREGAGVSRGLEVKSVRCA